MDYKILFAVIIIFHMLTISECKQLVNADEMVLFVTSSESSSPSSKILTTHESMLTSSYKPSREVTASTTLGKPSSESTSFSSISSTVLSDVSLSTTTVSSATEPETPVVKSVTSESTQKQRPSSSKQRPASTSSPHSSSSTFSSQTTTQNSLNSTLVSIPESNISTAQTDVSHYTTINDVNISTSSSKYMTSDGRLVTSESGQTVTSNPTAVPSIHNVSNFANQKDKHTKNTGGIVAGVLCASSAVVMISIGVTYFKRRQRLRSVAGNITVNYESEKYEDINDADFDATSQTSSHYEKLNGTDPGNTYTMIVRESQSEKLQVPDDSIEDSSSYVMPNEFGAPPPDRTGNQNGVKRYENSLFSVDFKDGTVLSHDDNDYIDFQEDTFSSVDLS